MEGRDTIFAGLMRTISKGVRCLLVLAVIVCPAVPAAAQGGWEDRAFVNANLGFQQTARPFSELLTPIVYSRPASIVTEHPVTAGSMKLDVAGGVRLWSSFGVGLGYTTFELTDIATVDAQVPHPSLANVVRSAKGEAEVVRADTALNILAVWVVPITDHIDVALSGGPSLITVEQDLVSGVTFEEDSPTFATVAIKEVATAGHSERVLGYHGSADVTYFVTPMIGVGGTLRYVHATSVAGSTTIDAGGLQVGFGARIRIR